MRKKLFVTMIAVVLFSVYTGFASFSNYTVYRGREWHFDIEEKDAPVITVVPENREKPQLYGEGVIERVEPKQKKYDIIWLKNSD